MAVLSVVTKSIQPTNKRYWSSIVRPLIGAHPNPPCVLMIHGRGFVWVLCVFPHLIAAVPLSWDKFHVSVYPSTDPVLYTHSDVKISGSSHRAWSLRVAQPSLSLQAVQAHTQVRADPVSRQSEESGNKVSCMMIVAVMARADCWRQELYIS